MADASATFDGAMFEIYRQAKAEAGYNATIFLQMISDRGGLETAKYLINAPKVSEGYTHLYERGRLDLTVEALVVEEPRWQHLFELHPVSWTSGQTTTACLSKSIGLR